MGPAQAMGTFLRVWRSEWAGLSRAQLAIAVNAHCPKRPKTTTGVIRKWESGQPPSSTEEFEALCLVMRRHGLTRPEVEEFRRAVMAACVDRHYPELFPDGDFAHRADVDALAEANYRAAWLGDHRERQKVFVTSVVWLSAVGDALTPAHGSAARGPQRRKQEVALAFLQQAVSHLHGKGGRHRLALAASQASAPLVNESLGGYLNMWINRLGLQLQDLFIRSYVTMSERVRAGGVLTISDALVPEMLELSRHARDVQDAPSFSLTTIFAVDVLHSLGCPESWDAMQHIEADAVRAAGDYDAERTHYYYADTAARHHCWADVERHLEGFRSWAEHEDDWPRHAWEHFSGRYAMERGDYGEAISHFEKTLLLGDLLGDHGLAEGNRKRILQCEELLRTASRRKAKPRKVTRRAAK